MDTRVMMTSHNNFVVFAAGTLTYGVNVFLYTKRNPFRAGIAGLRFPTLCPASKRVHLAAQVRKRPYQQSVQRTHGEHLDGALRVHARQVSIHLRAHVRPTMRVVVAQEGGVAVDVRAHGN